MSRIFLKSTLLVFLIGYGWSSSLVYAADINARAENIRLRVEAGKIIIHYDLMAEQALRGHSIRIFFSDHDYDNRIYPRSLSGDIGDNVVPGKHKRIYWDVVADDVSLDIPLQCNILVDDILGDGKTGGPAYAALSLAIPGLGDYFVADHRYMAIKPWMRTTSALGLTGIGIWSGLERETIMRLVPGHYATRIKWSTGEQTIVWIPDRLVASGTDYRLFPNDAEVLASLGIAIWLVDVFWVMNKGRKNEKLTRLTAGNFHFSAQPFMASVNGGLQYGLSIKF